MSLSLITAAALCASASEAVLCLSLDCACRCYVTIAAVLSACGYSFGEVAHALRDAAHCGLVDA